MCDCYWPRCQKIGCKERIPIHIGDFAYPRKDVKGWCQLHIPNKSVTIFTLLEEENHGEDEPSYPIGWKCALRLQGGKLEPHSAGVDPNLGGRCAFLEIDKKGNIVRCGEEP